MEDINMTNFYKDQLKELEQKVENATLTDIYLGNYRSKVKPQSLLGSLFAWMVRYNITVLFSKPEETGKLIHGILYYAARELLVNGKI